MTRKNRTLLYVSTACVLILGVLATFLDVPNGIRPRVYWLFWSAQYKRAVLSSPSLAHELRHTEWYGDGWGGMPVGDWTGYVVYDPSDSLPRRSRNDASAKIDGVPCEVVAVRRPEQNWYSVVTDMNQYWDTQHPQC